jgi:hypothetical protein
MNHPTPSAYSIFVSRGVNLHIHKHNHIRKYLHSEDYIPVTTRRVTVIPALHGRRQHRKPDAPRDCIRQERNQVKGEVYSRVDASGD